MKYSGLIVRDILLASLLVLSIPLLANAEPQTASSEERSGGGILPDEHYQAHHFMHEGESCHFPLGLDLSESQRDKIFSIKHTQAALFYEQGKIVRKAHIELHKLARSDQYDDGKAKAIADDLGKALAKITLLRVQEKHQIYALLTPEQRNLLSSHFDHAAEKADN